MAGRLLRFGVAGLAILALLTLGTLSAFADLASPTRSAFALAASGLMFALQLAMWPLTRPDEGATIERSAAVARRGRVLIRIVWLVRCVVVSYATYYVTANFDQPGFHPWPAALVVVSNVCHLLVQAARHVAGFVVDWSFLRGAALIRYLAGVAAAAALAGYAASLAHIAETVFSSGPGRLFRLLRDWSMWGWAAVLATIFLCLLASLLLVVVEGVLQRLAARAIGEDNAVGQWLAEHSPFRVERVEDHYSIVYINYFGFRIVFPVYRGPREPRRRDLVRMRAYEHPLSHREQQDLEDRVRNAMVAHAPPDWRSLRLDYWAADGHEEVVLTVNPNGRWILDAADRGESQRKLNAFTALEELRLLRRARYKAAYGAPFTQRFSVVRPSSTRYSPSNDRPWTDATTSWNYRDEPTWTVQPTRAHYRADLEKFPIPRRSRPAWLRKRLRMRPRLPR